MIKKLFYFLKLYLGLSNKESKGLVLFVPFLFLIICLPFFIQKVQGRKSEIKQSRIDYLIDSLLISGFEPATSPLPIFNPLDTGKVILPASVQKILFSEADSITLQIVPGIGPAMASRVIKFRENLGGLVHKDQLKEVFGMKEEVADQIWNYFDFDRPSLRKIPINQADINTLAKHPYIGYGEAKVIFAFRNQHGPFSSADDLLKIKIFKEDWVNKLSPYLSFSD